jgi:hypothetical protein
MAVAGIGAVRTGIWAAILALLAATPCAAALCLPSLAEGGRRLHEMPAPSVYWLELLLRQHEACWTADAPHEQLRVFLYGNSAVLGHPEAADDTAAEHLNGLWRSAGLPAHAFNFGFVTAHAVKDMLIVHETLRYRPDVIVYGVIPTDFSRFVATRYVAGGGAAYNGLVRLMRTSARAVLEFAAEEPPGLARPLGLYRRAFGNLPLHWWRGEGWPGRDVLTFAFTATRTRLHPLGERLGLVEPPGKPASGKAAGPYFCAATRSQNARIFNGWSKGNSFAYLARVRERTGIPIVVVDWPIAHEPRGNCYNSYVTNKIVASYRAWLAEETARLEMPLIDLSHTLLPRDFHDTLHPNARGQRKIAGAIAGFLEPILRRRMQEVLLVAAPH